MLSVTKAMVMAAGKGVRMRPLTDHKPKPLIEVAGKPLIDHSLDWLAAAGVREAVINTHYLAAMLRDHVAKRRVPKITLSHEEAALETGGGINHALPLLGEAPFFAVNSDVICLDGKTPALRRLAAGWDDARMDALLLLHKVARAVGYDGPGDFFLEADLRRRGDAPAAPLVFTGVQLIHPRLFVAAPEGAFSLNLLYDRALADGRLAALVHDGDWLHVGDPEGLKAAGEFFRSPNKL